MCGITGSFGSKRDFACVNAELLHLIHRGPDFQGTYTDDSYLTMGCARLAMTDPLPRSNQPFLLNKGRQILTFNGEIYNFQQLTYAI